MQAHIPMPLMSVWCLQNGASDSSRGTCWGSSRALLCTGLGIACFGWGLAETDRRERPCAGGAAADAPGGDSGNRERGGTGCAAARRRRLADLPAGQPHLVPPLQDAGQAAAGLPSAPKGTQISLRQIQNASFQVHAQQGIKISTASSEAASSWDSSTGNVRSFAVPCRASACMRMLLGCSGHAHGLPRCCHSSRQHASAADGLTRYCRLPLDAGALQALRQGGLC